MARMLNALLQDEVEDWWNTYYQANNADQNKMKQKPISKKFKNQFCIQKWINKWTRNLEKHIQGLTETVTSYHATFKKLLKRTDSQGNLSEAQKLYYFIKRLFPYLALLISISKPNNITAAL